MSKKYIIALDGYGNSYNSNSYAIIDNTLQELKDIKEIKTFNMENWVCNDESVDYDIIQFPDNIFVFVAYQNINIRSKTVHTKISPKDNLNDDTKSLIENYFKCNKNYKYTFEYLINIAVADTIEELKSQVTENDFAFKYLCDEKSLKEISNFFSK